MFNISECFTQADVCFVIDSSGSIRDSNPPDQSRDNWMTILTFVNDIINVFTVGENDTRVGLIRFSNNALFTFPLNQFTEKSALRQAVLGVQYIGGTTNTAEALQLTTNECFNTENGDRPDVDNLAIIITDGLPTVFDLDLPTEAAALKRKANVFCCWYHRQCRRESIERCFFTTAGIKSELLYRPRLLEFRFYSSRSDNRNLSNSWCKSPHLVLPQLEFLPHSLHLAQVKLSF